MAIHFAIRGTQWKELLENVADYPLTQDEWGETVFAQASLNTGPESNVTDGFPVTRSGGEVVCNFTHAATPDHADEEDDVDVTMASTTSGCGNARYPIVHFNAMHPGEDIDLASDASTLKIARRTTSVINNINDYSPTNGLCMSWPPSARVVNSSTMLLGKFEQALQDTMMPNFIPFIVNRPTGGSGCNIEVGNFYRNLITRGASDRLFVSSVQNSGATVAINDLLASVHGHGPNATLRIFPGGWPVGQAVSFQEIRVRGAFTVSAAGVGQAKDTVKLTGAVNVTSLAGKPLTFLWETGTPTVTARAGGGVVALKGLGAGRYSFDTSAGKGYSIV